MPLDVRLFADPVPKAQVDGVDCPSIIRSDGRSGGKDLRKVGNE
jgi:hypothetical protein